MNSNDDPILQMMGGPYVPGRWSWAVFFLGVIAVCQVFFVIVYLGWSAEYSQFKADVKRIAPVKGQK